MFDYPELQRSDILDYLYRPAFGAGLTMCKIEIKHGQSTDGAEASHMHTRGDLNFERLRILARQGGEEEKPKVTIYGLRRRRVDQQRDGLERHGDTAVLPAIARGSAMRLLL